MFAHKILTVVVPKLIIFAEDVIYFYVALFLASIYITEHYAQYHMCLGKEGETHHQLSHSLPALHRHPHVWSSCMGDDGGGW